MNFSKQSIAFGVGGLVLGGIVVASAFYFCPYGKKYNDRMPKQFMDDAIQAIKEQGKETTQTDSKTKVETVTKTTVATTSIEIYKQWAIPEDVDLRVLNEKTDVVSISSDYFTYGDLLSTMIVFHKNMITEYPPRLLKLSVFTEDYMRGLERDFAHFTQAKKGGDFYAAYVAHLGEGIDAVAGNVKGKNVAENPSVALIRVNGTVYELENPKRVFNQSATGADVYPCEADLKNKEILWTCFEGFATAEGEGITGSQMSETRYSLTGKKLGMREYAE